MVYVRCTDVAPAFSEKPLPSTQTSLNAMVLIPVVRVSNQGQAPSSAAQTVATQQFQGTLTTTRSDGPRKDRASDATSDSSQLVTCRSDAASPESEAAGTVNCQNNSNIQVSSVVNVRLPGNSSAPAAARESNTSCEDARQNPPGNNSARVIIPPNTSVSDPQW